MKSMGTGPPTPPQHKLETTGKIPGMESHQAIQWLYNLDEDIRNHMDVMKKGYPNRWGAKIHIKSRWDLNLLEKLLRKYEDKEVVEWLKYGWPTGRLPNIDDPERSYSNHKGGSEYPGDLEKYIKKELGKEAIMGPYKKIPFRSKVGISPLSTRAKKNSTERRVILDLSFPEGRAVNTGIDKDYYMGFKSELTFPKVDEFALRIYQLGENAMMFKVDLSRYFRQIPLDPGDYSLIGYIIDNNIYFDKVLPMGMRSAPYIAQRLSNAIAWIHRQLEYYILNYVDDFVGAEEKQRIWISYTLFTQLLEKLKVDTAPDKVVPPTTKLEFLGIMFNSATLTMEVTPDRLNEIKEELKTWLTRTSATRKEVESLIGKLQFMSKCVKAGRIFLARLISWIRGMNRSRKYLIPQEARKDIAWWGRFAMEFNGIELMWLVRKPIVDEVIATDACKIGYGGTLGEEYFRGKFPEEMNSWNIAVLELLAVMVALKTWGGKLTGLYFWIHVDNEAVATILNTGSSRDNQLQDILREIALIAARNSFVIKAKHISGLSNRIPDWLSRWHQVDARNEFNKFAQGRNLHRKEIKHDMLQLQHNW